MNESSRKTADIGQRGGIELIGVGETDMDGIGAHHSGDQLERSKSPTSVARCASMAADVNGQRMRITGPVLDAADAVGLARFYERLLGWTMVECEGPRDGYPPEDGWAKLRSPEGTTSSSSSGRALQAARVAGRSR